MVSRRDFTRTALLGLPALPWWLGRTGAHGPELLAGDDPTRSAHRSRPRPNYDSWIVIDGLSGPGARLDSPGSMGGNLTPAALRDVRRSGVTAVNLTVGTVGNREGLFEEAVRSVAEWQRKIVEHPEHLTSVRAAEDILEAKRSRRLGIIFGFQDSAMLEGELDRVDLFHDLGVKILQLTYNRRNELGYGSIEPDDSGLTPFGRDVVGRANALGIMVDLSHCGRRTTNDGIRASRDPVAITHTGCRAVANLPRNKSDATLRLLADNGGVVGIYFMPFLRVSGQPVAADVIRHIEHAINVCGEDHVGIGTDGVISPLELTPEYVAQHRADVAARRAAGISAPGETDDVYTYIPDLNTPRRLEALANMLAARGHGDARIAKILGGNFLRLMGEVW